MDPYINKQEVVVVDIRMPFVSMVHFMVKWALATIPAMIILFFVALICFALLRGFYATGQ